MANIDFSLHKIFVEGNTDQACIEKILELRFGISFPHNGYEVKDAIISCNGWTNLEHQPALENAYRRENGGKNIVIFDADGKSNDGGFTQRSNSLQHIATRLGINFEIFLFPNNKEDGALEDFYSSCFKNEMKFFEHCWSGMISCFESSNQCRLILNLPHTNGKIYSYVDLFDAYKTGSYKNTKGKRHYFDDGLWQFDFEHNENLKELVTFIETCSIVTE